MEKKRVLVTGGAGFIGSHLTRFLYEKGYSVDVIDDLSSGDIGQLIIPGWEDKVRIVPLIKLWPTLPEDDDKITCVIGDFTDPVVLRRLDKYDIIFFSAAIPRVAYSVADPVKTTETNIFKTIKFFHACVGKVDRVVWASSSSVYGGPDTLPIHESAPHRPQSPYAWQKSAVETAAKLFGDLYNLDIVCLRYFSVFGPGQSGKSPYSTVVAAWCQAVADGRPLRLDGTGLQSRDLCYVDNIVNANYLAGISEIKFNGRAYNVGCGDNISLNAILEYFQNRFPNVEVECAPPRKGDVLQTQADIRRAAEELGYISKVEFWDGLERTIKSWHL